MTELEACAYAAGLLKAVGFEHRYSSMRSEACYYAMAGQTEVLRIAAHRYGGSEYGLAKVAVCLTITASKQWSEMSIHAMTARAIGLYLLRVAGAAPLSARERAKRHYHRAPAATTSLPVV